MFLPRRSVFKKSLFSSTSVVRSVKLKSLNVKKTSHPDPLPTSPIVQHITQDNQHLLHVYSRPPLVITKGEGVYLTDSQGRDYLDMNAGIAVNALGHHHPLVVKILAKQAKEMIHLSNLYHHPYAGPFAKELVESLGCDQPGCPGVGHCQQNCSDKGRLGPESKVFFCNSGTEANEGAIKFARKIGKVRDPSGKKIGIVSFGNAFHGRSMGALSATPSPKYQKPFYPLVPGFKNVPFNHTQEAIQAIDESTCAVIVEPIQGEGGIHVSHKDFLPALRKRCDEVKALLIFDEIQCGLGRTGKLFGYQNFGVTPDLLTMAKPLANGFPIGAIILSPEVASQISPGDHGTTFGGSPLATHVGHVVFNEIKKPKFLKHVEEVGKYLKEALLELNSPLVHQVRGLGLMIGMQLKEGVETKDFVDLCRERGVLVISAGSNTIRLVPPLVIKREDIDKALGVFKQVLKIMEKKYL